MNVLGEMLALTVGKLGVLAVKGVVKILKVAADMETTWRALRMEGNRR